MASPETINDATRHRVHVIEGTWATKALHIDGHPLTVAMIRERIHRAGFSGVFERVQTFAWGPDAPLDTVQLMAYGCCELTVPETWIQNRAAHMALEAFFLRKLHRLPPADFSLRYTEQALRNALRRIQRWWLHQLHKSRHTLRL